MWLLFESYIWHDRLFIYILVKTNSLMKVYLSSDGIYNTQVLIKIKNKYDKERLTNQFGSIFSILKSFFSRQKKKYVHLFSLLKIWSKTIWCVRPIVVPTIHGFHLTKNALILNKNNNSQEWKINRTRGIFRLWHTSKNCFIRIFIPYSIK